MPACGFRLEHAGDDRLDPFVQPGDDLAERRGRAVEARLHHLEWRFAVERRPPGQRVVQRGPETVNVGPLVRLLPPDLLGGDVVGGTPDAAGGGLVDEAGQAEIHEFRLHFLVKKNVLRLHVSMREPDLAGRLERLGHVDADFQDQAGIEGFAFRDHLVEPLAGHQLHDDVGLSLGFAKRVDLRDVRVVKLGGSLGFALEGLERVPVFAQGTQHDLDCDVPAEGFVLGDVHAAHPAHSEQAEKDERSEFRGHRLDGATVRALDFHERFERRDVDAFTAARTGNNFKPVRNDADRLLVRTHVWIVLAIPS